MSQFPKTEGDVIVLANELKSGLAANTTVYPAPPVATTELDTLLTALIDAENAAVAAVAASESATLAKNEALAAMADAMKKDIRYAENTVNNDDDKLKLIGWGAKKAPTALTSPGQTLNLIVYPQGEGWIELKWKAPAEGGKPAVYKVQRKLASEESFSDFSTSFETGCMLENQPRGVTIDYRIVASNKAGDGMASNTVTVVL